MITTQRDAKLFLEKWVEFIDDNLNTTRNNIAYLPKHFTITISPAPDVCSLRINCGYILENVVGIFQMNRLDQNNPENLLMFCLEELFRIYYLNKNIIISIDDERYRIDPEYRTFMYYQISPDNDLRGTSSEKSHKYGVYILYGQERYNVIYIRNLGEFNRKYNYIADLLRKQHDSKNIIDSCGVELQFSNRNQTEMRKMMLGLNYESKVVQKCKLNFLNNPVATLSCIVASGLVTYGTLWSNFLTVGLYDPRLLLHINVWFLDIKKYDVWGEF